MSKERKLTRGKFLILLAGLMGGSFAGGFFLSSARLRNSLADMENGIGPEKLAYVIDGIENQVNLIGKQTVEQHFQDVPKKELLAEIDEALLELQLSQSVLMDVHERIRSLILQDLRENRVLKVNHWLLTVTEARLCAASYL